ncbi:hypothetical protein D3C80_1875030 [compost metagenome]
MVNAVKRKRIDGFIVLAPAKAVKIFAVYLFQIGTMLLNIRTQVDKRTGIYQLARAALRHNKIRVIITSYH